MRTTTRNALLLLLTVVSFSACKKDQGPIMVMPDATDSTGTTVSFQNDVAPIFQFGGQPQCTVCHPNSADLNLLPDSAYNNLVNVPTTNYSGQYMRVIPGDTTNSVLWDKINDYGNYGMGMPPPSGGLSAESIEVIGRWIMEGAQNN